MMGFITMSYALPKAVIGESEIKSSSVMIERVPSKQTARLKTKTYTDGNPMGEFIRRPNKIDGYIQSRKWQSNCPHKYKYKNLNQTTHTNISSE
jgi:hypothetical protein